MAAEEPYPTLSPRPLTILGYEAERTSTACREISTGRDVSREDGGTRGGAGSGAARTPPCRRRARCRRARRRCCSRTTNGSAMTSSPSWTTSPRSSRRPRCAWAQLGWPRGRRGRWPRLLRASCIARGEPSRAAERGRAAEEGVVKARECGRCRGRPRD